MCYSNLPRRRAGILTDPYGKAIPITRGGNAFRVAKLRIFHRFSKSYKGSYLFFRHFLLFLQLLLLFLLFFHLDDTLS